MYQIPLSISPLRSLATDSTDCGSHVVIVASTVSKNLDLKNTLEHNPPDLTQACSTFNLDAESSLNPSFSSFSSFSCHWGHIAAGHFLRVETAG